MARQSVGRRKMRRKHTEAVDLLRVCWEGVDVGVCIYSTTVELAVCLCAERAGHGVHAGGGGRGAEGVVCAGAGAAGSGAEGGIGEGRVEGVGGVVGVVCDEREDGARAGGGERGKSHGERGDADGGSVQSV